MKMYKKKIDAKILFIIAIILLVFSMLYSMTKGAAMIPLDTVWDSIVHFDKENMKHLMVIDLRLPRVLGAALVGAALATSGAIMQGLTKNPLADAGLMGLNSGAGVALAICLAFFQSLTYTHIIMATFIGAAIGAISVYGISALVPGGNSPMKLVLSGAALTALFSGLSQALSISFRLNQSITFWTMGSTAGINWEQIKIAVVLIGVAVFLACIMSKKITILSMGDELATGLGVSVKAVKGIGILLVISMAATSYSLAGSISFVGILIPHLVRGLVGTDYKKIIPNSAIIGALLLVIGDLLSKTMRPPTEFPVGAFISIIGVPAFLIIARRHKGGQ